MIYEKKEKNPRDCEIGFQSFKRKMFNVLTSVTKSGMIVKKKKPQQSL